MTSGEFVYSFRAQQRQQFRQGFTERVRACLADFPAFDRFEIKPDEVSSFRNVLTGGHSVSHLEIRWRRQRFRVRLRGGEIFQQFPFAVR